MNQTEQSTPAVPHHFRNSGYPVPPADPFQWVEDQRVIDLHTLLAALNQAANKFRRADIPTPKEPYSVLKGRALDEGNFHFKANIAIWNKDHAVLLFQEVAAAIGAHQKNGNYGLDGADGTWSLTIVT